MTPEEIFRPWLDQRVTYVTTYDKARASLGGAAWVDTRVLQSGHAMCQVQEFLIIEEAAGNGVELELSNARRAVIRTILRMVFRREPYVVAKFRQSKAWRERTEQLRAVVQAGGRVVTSQWPGLLLAHDSGVPVDVHIAHNVDYVLSQVYDPLVFKSIRNPDRTRRFELTLLAEAAVVVALSAEDQRVLVERGIPAQHLSLLEEPSAGWRAPSARAIGFLGKASWPPNQTALKFLRENVMPQVRRKLGDGTPRLVVAGRGSEQLQGHDVVALGEIDSVEPFYRMIDLVVVPRMEDGSGVSVKLLEALHYGVFAIAPSSLVSAIGGSRGCRVASTAEEIANAIVEFYQDVPMVSENRHLEDRSMPQLQETDAAAMEASRFTESVPSLPFTDLVAPHLISTAAELDLLPLGGPWRLQTINLHHLALAKECPTFRRAVQSATYTTADGWPVAAMLSATGRRVERVTGSDWLERLVSSGRLRDRRVGLIGGTTESAVRFEELLGESLALCEVGDKSTWAASDMVSRLRECRVDVLIVAVTPPFGDVFAYELVSLGFDGSVISAGGAVDMLVGLQLRAPMLARVLGMEWLWRMAKEPRRLGRRYLLQCLPVYFRHVLPETVRNLRRGNA